MTVTPFATKDENGVAPDGDWLPRCGKCDAYFNTYCELELWDWSCSLCGTLNGLSSQAIATYSHPQSCAEMISSFIDLAFPLEESHEEMMQACSVYVAAVDLSSSEEFLELTRNAMQAALEAVPPGALFGLATFSHKIGLYDVQGAIPVVKNVFIPTDMDGTLSLELNDVMPLSQFLALKLCCTWKLVRTISHLRLKHSGQQLHRRELLEQLKDSMVS